jgi:hypothetical protein
LKNIITENHWEYKNLSKLSAEIHLFDNDHLNNQKDLSKLKSKFEHIVAKVPLSNCRTLALLNQNNFKFDELQFLMEISLKKTENIDKCLLKSFVSKANHIKVQNDADINIIIDNINRGMFHTDRFSINPNFGKDVSSKRYTNWVKYILSQKGEIYTIICKDKPIGFMMFDNNSEYLNYLLGGLFPDIQDMHYGVQIIAQPLDLMINLGLPKMQSRVSSNNPEVISLYKYFNFSFNLNDSYYVFTFLK